MCRVSATRTGGIDGFGFETLEAFKDYGDALIAAATANEYNAMLLRDGSITLRDIEESVYDYLADAEPEWSRKALLELNRKAEKKPRLVVGEQRVGFCGATAGRCVDDDGYTA
ncbi:MAG: hypothetical protein LBP79_04535 [Clostridiales bacterium]|nr:hypothetical protein [Clostridiales bacterium]